MLRYSVILLLILVQLSILTHVWFIAGYFSSRSNRDFKGFLVTLGTNFALVMTLAVIAMKYPEAVRSIRLEYVQIIESGLIFFYFLALKISITVKVILRSRDERNYHYSFFNKKVYNQSVITKKELAVFLITMPFTILFGAIFVSKVSTYL